MTQHISSNTLRCVVGAALTAALLPLGCARDAAPIKSGPPAATLVLPAGLPPEALARLPAAFASQALGLAPADAEWLVSFRVGELAEAVDLPGLVARHPEVFEGAREELSKLSGGIDLLVLENFRKAGVDLDRPMGFFSTDATSGKIAFFVSVTDPGPILGRLDTVARESGTTLSREDAGGALLVTSANEEFSVLVRDGVLYVIFGMGRSERPPSEVAKAMRATDPASGLAQAPDFLGAVEGLVAGDAGVYVRPEPLLIEEAGEGDVEAGLALGALKGLDCLALGLDASPSGATLRARPSLREGSPVAGLLRASEGPLLAMRVVEPGVLARFGVKVDPKATLEKAVRLMDPEGADLSGLATEVEAELGLDLVGQILPALTGELGVAVTGDLMSLFDGKEAAEVLGLTVVAGATDAKAVEGLLAAVAKKAGKPKASWSASTRTLSIRTGPGKDARAITARVEGAALIVSTNPAAAVSHEVQRHTIPKVGEVCEAPGLSLGASLDLGLVVAEDAGRTRIEDDATPVAAAGEPPELRAKRRALEGLKAEARALRRRLDRERGALALEALRPFGSLAHGLRLEDGRLGLEFGLFPAGGTFFDAISGVIAMEPRLDAMRASPAWMRLSELEEELWRLQMELDNTSE